MLFYSQSTGIFKRDDITIATGYSGFGEGKNDPSDEHRATIGPIPKGLWKITGIYDSKRVGPRALILEPCEGTETYGRSAFRIHGDSIAKPGSASHGCIILPRHARLSIWRSNERLLTVTE